MNLNNLEKQLFRKANNDLIFSKGIIREFHLTTRFQDENSNKKDDDEPPETKDRNFKNFIFKFFYIFVVTFVN